MARQINLAALSASGDLTVSLENPFTSYTATEDVNSNGVTSLFDGLSGQADPKLVLNNQVSAPGGVPKECVVLNFNTPIKAQEIRIDNIMANTTIYNIYINAGVSDTDYAAKVVKSIPYSANPTLRSADLILPGGFLGTEIRNIVVELGTSNVNNDHILSEIELYIEKEAENPNFEFNDSVLDTKAWNSSRYDGRQLEGAVVNEFRAGDITYGKTPVLRRYTKNIYIGNNIIGLDSSSLASDNSDLAPFNERFSYAQCNTFITVNDDGTIEKFNLDDTKGDNLNKIGFYRAFYEDFSQGDRCNILITDPVVENNLKPSHDIYFNEGQLKSLFNLTPRSDDSQYVSLIYTSGSFNIINIYAGGFDVNEGIINYGVHFRNIPLTQLFYTRSLYLQNTPNPTSETTDTEFHRIFEGFFNYKDNAEYKGNKRLFVTFLSGSGLSGNFEPIKPIILEEEENYGGNQDAIRQDLSFLSTCEINSVTDSVSATSTGATIQADTYKFYINPKYSLSQDYQSRVDFEPVVTQGQTTFGLGGGVQPQDPSGLRVGGYEKGSLLFSLCDDNIPSLLINLNKALELPSGQGTKPFIIVPSNLHPYIKDNLFYFLTRAGIDIGGNTSAIIPLDQTKRYPDRIGWNPPKPAPTPELEAAQEAKTEISFEQRRLLAKQLAEQNRRRRLERLREEEENQRRNKRQSKREDRQEERKERKKRREERKENRRENRQERREDRREDRQNRRENRRNRRRNR